MILKKLQERLSAVSSVCTYVSMKDEADTRQLIDWCFTHRIRVCVPKCESSTLGFYEINSWHDLKPGTLGILEPVQGRKVSPETFDVAVIPLSAFDGQGHRTGYGKGYYDRVMGKMKHKIGIAYACQKVSCIDTDSWDKDLDEVITE